MDGFVEQPKDAVVDEKNSDGAEDSPREEEDKVAIAPQVGKKENDGSAIKQRIQSIKENDRDTIKKAVAWEQVDDRFAVAQQGEDEHLVEAKVE